MELMYASEASLIAAEASNKLKEIDVSAHIDHIAECISVAANAGKNEVTLRERMASMESNYDEQRAIQRILEEKGYTVYATHPKTMDDSCLEWTFVIKWPGKPADNPATTVKPRSMDSHHPWTMSSEVWRPGQF